MFASRIMDSSVRREIANRSGIIQLGIPGTRLLNLFMDAPEFIVLHLGFDLRDLQLPDESRRVLVGQLGSVSHVERLELHGPLGPSLEIQHLAL